MIDKDAETGHPPFDRGTADKLLEMLSTDDEFRALFQQDAGQALAQIGYSLPEQASPLRCTKTERLASKQEIAQARDSLQSYLTAQGPLTVIFAFEAGQVSSLRRR